MSLRKTENIDERELLYRLREGDHDAFEEIYYRYKDRLIGNLLRILQSRELVEELVQELFLKVWNGRESIDPEQSFKAYLFGATANMAKNVFREMYYDKRHRSTLLPIEEQVYSHIEEHLVAEENKQILDYLINRLPPQRRLVFTLCKLEGKSYKEVSKMLNISENTVNDHISKAYATLRQLCTKMETIGVFISVLLSNGL